MRLVALLLLACALLGAGPVADLLVAVNPTGEARTLTRAALEGNAFFQPLGANGRSCGTCHRPSDGWSLGPATARRLFEASEGRDPLFRRRVCCWRVA
jgi:cytochrome c peroxidase